MPVMEISIVPLGTQTPSVSCEIARVMKILKREKKIKYLLTPMGTIVQAESTHRLLSVAKKMHASMFNKKIKRVVTTIKIDERKDKILTMNGKIQSVKEKMRHG